MKRKGVCIVSIAIMISLMGCSSSKKISGTPIVDNLTKELLAEMEDIDLNKDAIELAYKNSSDSNEFMIVHTTSYKMKNLEKFDVEEDKLYTAIFNKDEANISIAEYETNTMYTDIATRAGNSFDVVSIKYTEDGEDIKAESVNKSINFDGLDACGLNTMLVIDNYNMIDLIRDKDMKVRKAGEVEFDTEKIKLIVMRNDKKNTDMYVMTRDDYLQAITLIDENKYIGMSFVGPKRDDMYYRFAGMYLLSVSIFDDETSKEQTQLWTERFTSEELNTMQDLLGESFKNMLDKYANE